jgi:rubrerythrin
VTDEPRPGHPDPHAHPPAGGEPTAGSAPEDEALAALQAGKDLSKMDVYLCPVCGDVEFGEPPEKCPICGAPASKYVKVG